MDLMGIDGILFGFKIWTVKTTDFLGILFFLVHPVSFQNDLPVVDSWVKEESSRECI